jgi:hypothetical protein
MKNKIYTSLFVILFVLILSQMSKAQDVNFSQFYDLPVLRNPAIAGLFNGDVRVTSGFRNQWQSVTVPFKTIALAAEFKKMVSYHSGDFVTFGIQTTNDMAGDSKLSRTQFFPFLN